MQDHDWNDLTSFLALHRSGSLSGAGLVLGVSETTVARRIKRLEANLATPLFARDSIGRYQLSDVGVTLLDHALRIETENAAIRAVTGQAAARLQATVRISAVPLLVNHLLLPHVQVLQDAHPGLTVELVPQSRNVDLIKREADLALRFSRPVDGGLSVKARKLGAMPYDVFAPAAMDPAQDGQLGWVTYDASSGNRPHARWIEAEVAGTLAPRAAVRVSDAQTALNAVACGLGKTLLPSRIGGAVAGVRPSTCTPGCTRLTRDVWLLSHADQDHHGAIAVAKEWLAGLPIE